jgi:hypothetical protein
MKTALRREDHSRKIWAAGGPHTLKSFGVEGIYIDPLITLARRLPSE